MEKKVVITCPFCKGKDVWYIHASVQEKVYQCSECIRYFKVQDNTPVNHGGRPEAAEG